MNTLCCIRYASILLSFSAGLNKPVLQGGGVKEGGQFFRKDGWVHKYSWRERENLSQTKFTIHLFKKLHKV
jgi:hypothetical protein